MYLTEDGGAISNRLLESIHLREQNGAYMILYVNAISDGSQTNPIPDSADSQYVKGPVVFTDFSFGVNPDDPTQAEVSFQFNEIHHWITQETTVNRVVSPIFPRLCGVFYCRYDGVITPCRAASGSEEVCLPSPMT